MSSETLVMKSTEEQLSHIFHLRGLISSPKILCFLVVLLCPISNPFAYEPCTVKEGPNQCKFERCSSYRGNFDSPDVHDSHVDLGSVSTNCGRQHRLENACPPSNLFCFPSTLSGFEDEEINTALEELDASEVQPEGFSCGLKRKGNLSQLPYHGNFMFLGGRNISCSLYQENGFLEFSSGQVGTKNHLITDVSSCVNPQFDKNAHSSMSVGNNEYLFSVEDGFSTPPVEINPSVLDWGHGSMYHPSLAHVTVINLDGANVFKVYDSSSTDSQFFPCESSEVLLAPGENTSICFVFLPTRLGSASAKLIIQTSFGGFLIQAQGFSTESRYLINPHGSLEILPGGRWRKSVSLFNSFDDTLHLEEIAAWISISSRSTYQFSKSICHGDSKECLSDYNALNAKFWLIVERGESGKPKIVFGPRENWVVGPKKTETLMELDISGHFEGKIVGALCMQLLRFQNSNIDTIVVPLDVELSPENIAPSTSLFTLSMEALVPCNTSASAGAALSVRNDAPYSLSIIKVTQEGESKLGLHIKSLEGLILFPNTTTRVAFINYAHTHEVDPSCKMIVHVNDTNFPRMEIPCTDVICVCSGCRLYSSVRSIHGISVNYVNGGRFVGNTMLPSSSLKVVNTREVDELILRNWKSQATMPSFSVLDKGELLFPVVLVGNYSYQWITVRNPSHKPVVMQLILNSGEVINKCRIHEMLLQPSSFNTLVGQNSIVPTRYGFSIAKDGTIEAFVHPYGVATLGPILFRPFNRCEWRSSALIRNNLSGVEWLSLQAVGGSLSLVLHEEHFPIQRLKFTLHLPIQLNFSSPETSVGRSSLCSQSLTKEVYAKNTGDLPLEVLRIKVSGAECGLDGFVIHNCAGFSLQPGEHTRLRISYNTDFTTATVQRDLELVLGDGILVVPMKASIPLCLIELCRRSIFWMCVKKAVVVLVFVAFFFRKSSSLHARFKWKKSHGPTFFEMHRIGESIVREEALLVECCGGNATPCSEVSSPSSVLNLDTEEKLESRDLRVRVRKEKGRRQRKKKSSAFGMMLLSEASSSQSGNSTPPSPLSPAVLKKSCKNPLLEARNLFSRAPLEQSNKSKCSKISSNVTNTEALTTSKGDNFFTAPSTQEKPCLSKKVVSKDIAVPYAAAFASGGGGTLAPWARSSSLSPSNSPTYPHARAPGAKPQSQQKGGCEEKMGTEQNYTYDIWGDHLFGLPSAYQLKKASCIDSPSSIESDYDSFFVRGPQTLVQNTVLQQPVVSDLKGNE